MPRAQVEPCGSLAVTEGKKDYVIMSTKSYKCHFIFINSKLSYCVQKILIISACQLYLADSSIFPLSPSPQLRELIPPKNVDPASVKRSNTGKSCISGRFFSSDLICHEMYDKNVAILFYQKPCCSIDCQFFELIALLFYRQPFYSIDSHYVLSIANLFY